MAKILACFRPIVNDSTREHTARAEQDSNHDGCHDNRVVAYVELLRRTNEPLGLVLRGGSSGGVPVHVSALRPGGVADKSGALQVGDQVLSINGTATEHLLHSEIDALLGNSGNVINLEILYEPLPGADQQEEKEKTASITLGREGNSYGFTISGGRTDGHPITVSNVTVDSEAFRRGILKAGDRILKVNGADVSRCSQMETLSLLKAGPDSCQLHIEYNVPLHEGLLDTHGPLHVELQKPRGASLGIRLTQKDELFWISHVKEAGIADRCGALHKGDQLLSVNSVSLETKTIEEVKRMLLHSDLQVKLEIIPAHNLTEEECPHFSEAGDSVSVASHTPSLRSQPHRRSQFSLAPTLLCHPECMRVRLLADNIGFGLSLQGGGCHGTGHSAGYSPLSIATIDKNGPAARLGQLMVGDRILSLNGTRTEGMSLQRAHKLVQEAEDILHVEVEFDVQDTIVPTSGTFEVRLVRTASLNLGITINGSHEHGHAVWIAKLKPGGIAYRMGLLQPGDMLLSINGQSLESATLRDAAQLLQRAGDTVALTISKDPARRAAKPEPIIYSVELHRHTHSQSLGIILSGSQDYPGQPIVISKIKEGGVASKTGRVAVGDRILAINSESVFGRTLPAAVALLHGGGSVISLRLSRPVLRRGRSRLKSGCPAGKPQHRYGNESPYFRAGLPPGPHGGRSSTFAGGRRRLSAITMATSTSGRSTPDSMIRQPERLDPVFPRVEEGGGGGGPSCSEEGNLAVLRQHGGASAFSRPKLSPAPPKPSPAPPKTSPEGGPDCVMRRGSCGDAHSGYLEARQDVCTDTDEELGQEEGPGWGRRGQEEGPGWGRRGQEEGPGWGRRGSVPARLSPGSRDSYWDFKSRQGLHRGVPVGRVSPLTPSLLIPSPLTPSTDEKLRVEVKPYSVVVMGDAAHPKPVQPASSLVGSDSGRLVGSDSGRLVGADSGRLVGADNGPMKPATLKLEPLSVGVRSEGEGLGGEGGRRGLRVTPPPAAVEDGGGADWCLRDLEQTLLQSGHYIDQLRQMADSGSSDQDSDSEPRPLPRPLSRLPQKWLLEQVQGAMAPTQTAVTSVVLRKNGAADFGFSVADGLLEPGVFVRDVRPGGPAALSGQLQAFDRILKINEEVLQGDDCCRVVPLLGQLGEEITLCVGRNPLATPTPARQH